MPITPFHWVSLPTIDPGRLTIMPRPRGGEWLEDDLKSLKTAGVTHVVSLLMPSEITDLGLSQEAALCTSLGLEYTSFPIPDRQSPSSLDATRDLIQAIEASLKAGQRIVIHCRMGIGRSSTIAACVMAHQNISPTEAFKELSRVRGFQVPDTDDQRQWVERYVKQRQS